MSKSINGADKGQGAAHASGAQSPEEALRRLSPAPAQSAAGLSQIAAGLSQISVADIRHQKKMSQIPNDAPVILNLGKEVIVPAGSRQIEGREVALKGKIPGCDIIMPPIHFLSGADFYSLWDLASAQRFPVDGEELIEAPPLAWYCGALSDVLVPVPNVTESPVPNSIHVTAGVAKDILIYIIHEAKHAAGLGEFYAFRSDTDAALAMGRRSKPISNLAIMKSIHVTYGDSDVVTAQEEFEAHCEAHGAEAEISEYWRWVEELNEARGVREDPGEEE